MKRILFLPLLQMQSGHHQVADALMNLVNKESNEIMVKKVDLLSYSNKSLEKIITNSYLKFVSYAPKAYNLFYKNCFNATNKTADCKWYHLFLVRKLEQLLQEENPDLVVCTHAFPSMLLNHLKMKGKCNVPVVNVYTDFFVNSVWGIGGADFHLLPNHAVEEKLMNKYQVPKQSMIVAGIPVHEEITKSPYKSTKRDFLKILISGGNCGLGGIAKLASELKQYSQVEFQVLCGENNKLYNQILSWGLDHIKPLPYISSREEMNKLYETVDAIITKPGGVTVSEGLRKKLPIFIHSVLPGQEGINLTYLKERGLVFELTKQSSMAEQLISILNDDIKMNHWKKSLQAYHGEIDDDPRTVVDIIKSILNQEDVGRRLV